MEIIIKGEGKEIAYLVLAIQERRFMQAAVAKKAGLTKQQLSDVVKKRRRLEANEMFQICVAIGVTPDHLFTIARGQVNSTKDSA